MKILLAPAETKKEGGENLPLQKNIFFYSDEIIDSYETLVTSATTEELSTWFGIKKLSDVEKYQRSIKNLPTMKAIERYTGVAFEALDYNNLDEVSKKFVDTHVMLFSNLFGILKADDNIPEYKFKQGVILPTINQEKYYKEHLKEKLDIYLGDEILDLSSGYYQKYYKPTTSVITYKFLKGGKVVSHWAKHYRGEMVRQIALNKIESFAQLMNFKFDGLQLQEIQEKKNIKTIIMEIK
ncbi:MAG TPA: YaaA family protein [Arcobacter sp.]|nr:YaaA family protein [Arcobacter sp.]